MLRDTAHIQEKDAEFLNKRLDQRRKRMGLENGHVEPLYTMADAERDPAPVSSGGLPLAATARDRPDLRPYDAGHILGSSFVAAR